MKIKMRGLRGRGNLVDTKFDWGYKSDQEFALDMFNKKLQLEDQVKSLNGEIRGLTDYLSKITVSGLKRAEVDLSSNNVTIIEADKGELINNFVVRLADYAFENRCQVIGNFNDVKLSGGPNTSADYYLGYFWGVRNSKN